MAPFLNRCMVPSLTLVLLFAGLTGRAAPGNVDLPRYPSLSPDGSHTVFSWKGDLWQIPSSGGQAVRLTNHPGLELRSIWSRDGKRIFFESDRTGFQNLYVMNVDGTDVRQISLSDQTLSLAGVGVAPDGDEIVTFSSTREGDNYRSPRPFFMKVSGEDIHRVHNAFGSFPIWSADGRQLLFERGGAAWSRRHYRGADQRDIWLYKGYAEGF